MSKLAHKKEELSLWRNYFNGSIPDWIGSLNLLKHIYLNYNELSGELPIGICDLVNLQKLYIHDNSFVGMILF
jgi:Leucine-rich repeat (LRR) protein